VHDIFAVGDQDARDSPALLRRDQLLQMAAPAAGWFAFSDEGVGARMRSQSAASPPRKYRQQAEALAQSRLSNARQRSGDNMVVHGISINLFPILFIMPMRPRMDRASGMTI